MGDLPFIDLKSQYARIKSDVDARIQAVLAHGQYVMGPEVREAEARLAELAGVRHCITVSSGTDALLAPLMAYGIGQGDAVFLPSFTFTATAEVVALLGASPVFVDVDADTFNIDPEDLSRQVDAIRDAGDLRPALVIAVDLFGQPADYGALDGICRQHDIRLLADAAQSFGGHLDRDPVGSLTQVTSTSFYPAKPLGCYGDGGAIFTDDDELGERLASIRQHGQGQERYDIDRIGLNARFDSIQAAVILAKLEIFENEIAARQDVAAAYDHGLPDGVEKPVIRTGCVSAWAQYTIKVDDRDGVRSRLQAAGIPTAIYYPKGMHEQPAYRQFNFGTGDYPVTETLCAQVLSLPMHPYLSEAQIAQICESVRAATAA